MSEEAPCWLLWGFYICLCILLLLVLFNFIFIIFIITTMFIKNSLSRTVYCSYEVSWLLVLFFSISSSVLTWSMRLPIFVDALPQHYSILSFDIIYLWWHEGKGHRPVCWCHLSNIIPDSISSDNWEAGKNLNFFIYLFIHFC